MEQTHPINHILPSDFWSEYIWKTGSYYRHTLHTPNFNTFRYQETTS
jgi:hypothetical protein